jgi:hypothetical protein
MLGKIHFEMKEYATAKKYFKRNLDISPNAKEPHQYLDRIEKHLKVDKP